MEVKQSPLGDTGLFVILPGSWASIPLSSPEAITKRVSALVKKQIGTNDRLAARRRQFRDELIKSATQAVDEGAIAYSIALELLPGVPFSGAMLTRPASWPASVVIADDDEPSSKLKVSFPDATILDTQAGPVARQSAEGKQKFTTQSTPSLNLEYWLPKPDGSGLFNIAVSLPMVPDPDLFTELFDSVVDSVSWSASHVLTLDDTE